MVYIDSAAIEGVKVLEDFRKISKDNGLVRTFSFTQRYYDFESYVVFNKETILNVSLALVAVLVVLLVFTASITVTMAVLFCVILVDLFLFGLLAFWNVTLNSVTVVNIVIAIGLSVDYTAHIGHAYLTTDPDADEDAKDLTNHEKRVYKARGALGSMGTSVFHGAFSTFLAIVVLAPSNSYIFIMFFKMWFGIIVFGTANGFILLPVLLALCGPLNKVTGLEKIKAQVASGKEEAADVTLFGCCCLDKRRKFCCSKVQEDDAQENEIELQKQDAEKANSIQ